MAFRRKNELKVGAIGKIVILLKKNNQELIALAHNPGFFSKIKYIEIHYYYIYNKIML